MKAQSAFTLLELLVVLAIIGILMSIVALSVNEVPGVARERAIATEQAIVQKAIDAYLTKLDDDAVLVGRAEAAAAPICTGDADAPFAQYLRRCTKYTYWWEVHEGESISVTVHQVVE